MHITLTGNLGSGKSTICKRLSGEYGYEIFSTGTILRKIADDMGLSVLELNKLMCSDKKYDNLIDDTTTRIAKENTDKDLVFDSRLAWHFAQTSFKVFLSVSLDVAAARVLNDDRGAVESYSSLQDAMEQLKQRAETEDRRYKDLYHLDYFNFDNYNLILDSTYNTPEVLAEVMLEEKKLHEEAVGAGKPEKTRILVSPKRLGVEELTEAEKQKVSGMELALGVTGRYPEKSVQIRKNGQAFKIVAGEDIVKAAAAAGLTFVQCVLV